jgi:glycosyltransferase involved in cell wall biosynthesis
MQTTRKTILHTIDSLSVGGAETLLKNTIALLPEFDHIVVYLFEQDALKPLFVAQGVELISLQHRGWKTMPWSIYRLRKIIKQKKPILVHSHLFYSTFCTRLATPSTTPLVSTLHSIYGRDAFEKNKKSLWAERLLLKKRHALIAVSKYVLNDYLQHIPFEGKRYVLYNFLPHESFEQQRTSGSKGAFRFVAVGNLKEAKNYHYLLEIFKFLKPFDVNLDIYGIGQLEKELAEIIVRENLKVKLRGSANNIFETLQQYDFFIQASSHEGFGLSAIEAMAAGLPLFLSDIYVFKEITQGLAHFFPLNNAEKAFQIIREVINKKELNYALAAQAFTFVQTNYSAAKYRQNLLLIYEDVTQQKLVNKCVVLPAL